MVAVAPSCVEISSVRVLYEMASCPISHLLQEPQCEGMVRKRSISALSRQPFTPWEMGLADPMRKSTSCGNTCRLAG